MKTKKIITIILVIMCLITLSCESFKPADTHNTTCKDFYATVNINLTTSNNGSVNNAVVRLQNNENSNISYQRTATSSTVNFTDVEFGSYTLTIAHTGYNNYIIRDFSVQSATVSQTADLNAWTSTVNIYLSTSNSGSVYGAVVRLQHNATSNILYQGTAFSNTVNFTDVQYGSYTLTVTHSGYSTHTISSFSVQNTTVGQSVLLNSIFSTATVNINLSTSNGGSVNGAVVRLQHNINSNLSYQRTATSNTVNFTDVEFGSYTLTVTRSGYNTHTNTSFSVQSDTVNQSVTLFGPTAYVGINLSTSNGGSVFGAVVRLQHNANSSISYQRIASSNTVNFNDVEYGSYTLTVTLLGHRTHTNSSFSVQSATVNQSVTLNVLTASVNINLSTNNSGSVNGAVVRLQHNANSSISYQRTATSNTVNFTDVVYGSYTLTVTHTGYNTHTNSSFSVQSATVSQSVNLNEGYGIGDIGPAGGIIFYDKGSVSDGWRYLEAAPASSEFNAVWSTTYHDIPGTQTGIGTGKQNTQIIVADLNSKGQTGTAAQRCVALNINGFNDWFLPSRDELNLMYQNLHTKGLGDFGKGINSQSWMNWCYWSSSQVSTYPAWYQDFDHGGQGSYLKDYPNRVRAVRAF